MKTLSNALIGTVAAGAMALSSASPAVARDHRDNDGISAGDVIAGALIIGGIAAVASAASNDRDGRYDRDYRGDGYGYDRAGYDRGGYDRGYYRGNPRQAVEQCVRTAERYASRASYGGRADVTDVRDIDRTRWGYEVKGRIAVNTQGRDWRHGDARYGRGWGSDYRGYSDRNRGYDSGSFKCRIERGRVVDIDFSGLRGL
jgi:hypothetical protein